MQQRIAKLIAQLLTASRRTSQVAGMKALRNRPANQSIAQLIFTDYFTMTARTLLQSAAESFKACAYPLQTGDSIASIVALQQRATATAAEVIAWANRGATVTPPGDDDQRRAVSDQASDTWAGIAGASIDPGQMAVDNALVGNVLIEVVADELAREAGRCPTAARSARPPPVPLSARPRQALGAMPNVLSTDDDRVGG